MAVRVTAAHTAEARAEAGREAGEGGVAAAAAALAPGGFLGLPAPFSEEGWRLITLQYCSGFCHTLT